MAFYLLQEAEAKRGKARSQIAQLKGAGEQGGKRS
jgi:hypothetical protein